MSDSNIDLDQYACLVDNGMSYDRVPVGEWPFTGGRVAIHTGVMGDAVAFSATDKYRGREHMVARRTFSGWELMHGPDGRALRLPSVQAAIKVASGRLRDIIDRVLASPDRFEIDPDVRMKGYRASNAAYVSNKDTAIYYAFIVYRRAWGQDGNDIIRVGIRTHPDGNASGTGETVSWGLEVPPIIQPVERPLMVKF